MADADRELTLTERARRTQLIEVTIAMVAEHGYGQTSLSRIAAGAGITKAAVLYHFPTKDAVVEAAYHHVLTELITTVVAAVQAAAPGDGVGAYIRAMIAHLHAVPEHTRMLTEALTSTGAKEQDTSNRWQGLAEIMANARQARGRDGAIDLRALAIIVGGAIDAIVGERLHDPDFDTIAAGEDLVTLTERHLFAPSAGQSEPRS